MASMFSPGVSPLVCDKTIWSLSLSCQKSCRCWVMSLGDLVTRLMWSLSPETWKDSPPSLVPKREHIEAPSPSFIVPPWRRNWRPKSKMKNQANTKISKSKLARVKKQSKKAQVLWRQSKIEEKYKRDKEIKWKQVQEKTRSQSKKGKGSWVLVSRSSGNHSI